MGDQILPVGTVIALDGHHRGSWLKINNDTNTPPDLLVEHFNEWLGWKQERETAKARNAELVGVLRDARPWLSWMQERIDGVLAKNGDG